MRILLVGETWFDVSLHVKGSSNHFSSSYGRGFGKVMDAWGSGGHDVRHVATHETESGFPKTVSQFKEYDIVVLSDVPADSLRLTETVVRDAVPGPDPLRALDSWVRNDGGRLLMIGGYLSFSGYGGNAGYANSPLQETLPVEILGWDDRMETPAGGHIAHGGGPSGSLFGSFAPFPALLGYNRVRLKEGAELALTIDGDPLLGFWSVGSGRAAAFTSDCSEHWGSVEFMNWPKYPAFWNAVVEYLD